MQFTHGIRAMHAAKRCKAKSKRSGVKCKAPAMKGWNVCRMHGARGGAPQGQKNGHYRHGMRTKAAAAERQDTRECIRWLRKFVDGVS
jgi:hypothetical protein